MTNLQSAHYVNCILVSTRLKSPIPLRALDLRNESKLSFIDNLDETSDKTAVVLMNLETEDFCRA